MSRFKEKFKLFPSFPLYIKFICWRISTRHIYLKRIWPLIYLSCVIALCTASIWLISFVLFADFPEKNLKTSNGIWGFCFYRCLVFMGFSFHDCVRVSVRCFCLFRNFSAVFFKHYKFDVVKCISLKFSPLYLDHVISFRLASVTWLNDVLSWKMLIYMFD